MPLPIAAFVAASVLSTLAQVYFQNQASRKQERAARANEEAALQEAEAIRQKNQIEADRFRLRARGALSKQRAIMAKSGVSLLSPSFREVKQASQRAVELDEEIIRENGEAAVREQESRAKIFDLEAGAIRSTRGARAGVTLLGGATRTAGAFL